MATFEETVLALNPVAFWRLDENLGPVMSDASGNGFDGTYFDDCVFGVASPIVTDAGSSAVGGRVGSAPAIDGSDIDVSVGFTVGGWILFKDSFLADTATILCHNAQWGVLGGFTELSDPALPVNGVWYFVVGVRNGAVMRLYVNTELVNERVDLNVSDQFHRHIIGVNNGHFEYAIAGTHTADAPWLVGVSGGGNVWAADGVDEPFIFDYPLTEQQLVDIYEAAIGATFLKGRSDANPTAILRSEFEPDPISYPFRHNWTEPLTERIGFRTATSQAVAGVEEGVSERVAPRREFEFMQVLKNQSERRRFRALLWANQHRKWFVPVRQYAERLLESLAESATTTPVSPTYKDYEVNSWIGFRQLNDSGEILHWEERLITALNPNSVEHEPTLHAYSPYLSIVYPVKRARLPARISIDGHSDVVEEVNLTARLLPEDETLTPSRITQFSPSIKYRDVGVFDGRTWQSNDWSEKREYEVERAGEEVDFDTGIASFDSDTSGAGETFSYRMTLHGLDNISAFLGWYYERVGALQPLWITTNQSDFDILYINIPERQITVRDSNYSDAYALTESRRDLAFVYHDGTMAFRRVIAFELAGSNETLRLDAPVPTTTNLRAVSLLRYCRLDADQLELSWQTDQTVQVAWRFRELLDTPEGTGASSLSPSHSLSHSLSPSGSASPSSSTSLSLSPSLSPSPSASISPSGSVSPSSSISPSHSASPST